MWCSPPELRACSSIPVSRGATGRKPRGIFIPAIVPDCERATPALAPGSATLPDEPPRRQTRAGRAVSRLSCYTGSSLPRMSSAIRDTFATFTRRWSALRSARAEAAAARDFWDAGAPGEPEDRYWGSQPLVRRAINRRVTGDPNRWPMEWFAARYAPQALPLGLSVGCGTGLLERDILGKGLCERVEGVDFSPEAITEAERAAEEAGLARPSRLPGRGHQRHPPSARPLRRRLLPRVAPPHPQRRAGPRRGPVGPEAGRARVRRRVHGPRALRVDRRPLGLREERLRRAARRAQEPARARDPAPDGRPVGVRALVGDPARPAAASSRPWRTGPTAGTSSGSSSRASTSRGSPRTGPRRSRG